MKKDVSRSEKGRSSDSRSDRTRPATSALCEKAIRSLSCDFGLIENESDCDERTRLCSSCSGMPATITFASVNSALSATPSLNFTLSETPNHCTLPAKRVYCEVEVVLNSPVLNEKVRRRRRLHENVDGVGKASVRISDSGSAEIT